VAARGNGTPSIPKERDHSPQALDAAILSLAATQYGRVSSSQLREAGLGYSSIDHRVNRGWLTRVARGVYAVGLPQRSPQAAWITALLRAGPDAALSHASAGAAWAIRPSAAALIDLTLPRRKRPIEGIRLHRTVLAADELTTYESLHITTPSRTILDLAQSLSDARLEATIAEADKLQLDFTPSLQTLLQRYARHRGSAGLRRVIARIDHHGAAHRLRSELEADFLDFVLDSRWDPQPETNAWVEAGDRSFECDAVWRHARLIVELDSRAHHADWAAAERDREKDLTLTRHGWTVVRVTARMLALGRESLRADLEALIYTAAPAPT